MASPRTDTAPSQSQPQPLTPPAEPSQSNTTAPSTSQQQSQPSTITTNPGPSTTASTQAANNANSQVPLTSLTDNGLSKRPRDARLIHLILSSMSVPAYQERVPLQLLDFAYRYTSSVLTDALHIQAEGYDTGETAGTSGKGRGRGAAGGANAADKEDAGAGAGGAGHGGGAAGGGISLTALRMAIGQRTQYQFQQGMPKEFLVDLAAKRNAIGLPGSVRGGTKVSTGSGDGVSVGGVRLPSERFCLSGMGWGLRESWDSEGEEDVDLDGEKVGGEGDVEMGEGEGEDLEGDEGEEDQEGMEALFGKATAGEGGGDREGDEDQEMGEG